MKHFLQKHIREGRIYPLAKKKWTDCSNHDCPYSRTGRGQPGRISEDFQGRNEAVAHLEIAVVVPEYQGYGLQYELSVSQKQS